MLIELCLRTCAQSNNGPKNNMRHLIINHNTSAPALIYLSYQLDITHYYNVLSLVVWDRYWKAHRKFLIPGIPCTQACSPSVGWDQAIYDHLLHNWYFTCLCAGRCCINDMPDQAATLRQSNICDFNMIIFDHIQRWVSILTCL